MEHPDSEGAQELLIDAEPRRVMSRLLEGDPLGMQVMARRRRAELGALLPIRRVFLRSLARVSFEARKYRPSMGLEAWLEARVVAAVVDLMGEQAESVRCLDSLDPGDMAFYGGVARRLGLPAQQGRKACVAVNAEPLEVRHTLFAVVVLGQSMSGYCEAGFGPARRVRRLLRQGLEAAWGAGPGPGPVTASGSSFSWEPRG